MKGHYFYHAPAKRFYVSIPWNGKQEKFWKFKGEPIGHQKTASKFLAILQAAIDRDLEGKEPFDPRHYRPDSPLSIAEFSIIWLQTTSASKNTKKVYKNAIKHAIEYFGEDWSITDFKHSNLLLFKNQLQLSESGKYNVLTALKTMLRFYQMDVKTFILPQFPPLTKPEPETTAYLTFEEQQKVLQAIPEPYRPIFIIMMEYGLRPQEATALKWDCVSDTTITFKRSHSEYELHETTKTGSKGIREEIITTRAKVALDSAKKYPSFQGWVFSHNKRGSHFDNKILNRIWRTACEQTGIKIGLYEAVRHSLGCQLAEEGYSLDFIQDVFKHTSIKTTRRYAKRKRKMIANALENRGEVVAFRSPLEAKS